MEHIRLHTHRCLACVSLAGPNNSLFNLALFHAAVWVSFFGGKGVCFVYHEL